MTVSDREKEVLEFWDREQIFEKSVNERSETQPYVFFDGPPFATGLPHYGHLPSTFMKDAVPRYWTMKGYRVERVWGWDCHGLPIENIIEEKLGIKSKKDIEEYGIEKFNEQCRATVLTYAEEWKKIIRRIGRWVDMDHAYKTMDISFMESVWWVFSELHKKGLIYEGKKAMHICPRCVTALSNFEVTQGYQEVTDISVTAKFKLTNAQEKFGLENSVSLLAWTTTPWTLPGNVLLAVGPEIKYGIFQHKESGEHVIIAIERWSTYAEKIGVDTYTQVDGLLKGSDLVGLTYEPLFPYFTNTKNAFRVVGADFVTTEDGSGVVHIAPAFGEDDYQVGQREEVDFVQHVSMDGHFTSDITDFAGQEVKPKEDPTKADVEILKWLAKNGKLFHKEKYTHSYPHCWRCDTPLLNYATSSWFVSVTKIKDALLENNKKTAWVPEHMRDGRFGKWLENARDWAISRDRFWGAPLPVWKNDDGDMIVIGSVSELEKLSGKHVDDLHKHFIDPITLEKEGKTYHRVPQVLDCWFESGSMPYGQKHYPFENKAAFEAGFPAEFIAEGQDQTRGWFYVLHVLATALTTGKNPSIPVKEPMPAFKHVIVNGIVLAQDGKKMSKRLKNYPDLSTVIEQYGADAVRYYILSSPVVHAESLNFSETLVREVYNKVVNTLWNVSVFFTTFNQDEAPAQKGRPSLLDSWILARLSQTVVEVTQHMEKYEIAEGVRPLQSFITDLSQWYIRRSRDRFKDIMSEDRAAAYHTLREVLDTFSRLCAPFMPFLAEMIYANVSLTASSVHLASWPTVDKKKQDAKLLKDMESVRNVVEIAHSLRAEAKIKVRQPLSELRITEEFSSELCAIIADEVNVKIVLAASTFLEGEVWRIRKEGTLRIALCTSLTPELEREGLLRDVVRAINAHRKTAGLTPQDIVRVFYTTADAELSALFEEETDTLMKSVLASSFERGGSDTIYQISADGRHFCIEFRK